VSSPMVLARWCLYTRFQVRGDFGTASRRRCA
jgi:hypothetical protein